MPAQNESESEKRQDLRASFACLVFAVALSATSMVLGSALAYRDHMMLFNGLAILMLGLGFASLFISVWGFYKSRMQEYRLLGMVFLSAAYVCWLIFSA